MILFEGFHSRFLLVEFSSSRKCCQNLCGIFMLILRLAHVVIEIAILPGWAILSLLHQFIQLC